MQSPTAGGASSSGLGAPVARASSSLSEACTRGVRAGDPLDRNKEGRVRRGRWDEVAVAADHRESAPPPLTEPLQCVRANGSLAHGVRHVTCGAMSGPIGELARQLPTAATVCEAARGYVRAARQLVAGVMAWVGLRSDQRVGPAVEDGHEINLLPQTLSSWRLPRQEECFPCLGSRL